MWKQFTHLNVYDTLLSRRSRSCPPGVHSTASPIILIVSQNVTQPPKLPSWYIYSVFDLRCPAIIQRMRDISKYVKLSPLSTMLSFIWNLKFRFLLQIHSLFVSANDRYHPPVDKLTLTTLSFLKYSDANIVWVWMR